MTEARVTISTSGMPTCKMVHDASLETSSSLWVRDSKLSYIEALRTPLRRRFRAGIGRQLRKSLVGRRITEFKFLCTVFR